MDQARIDTLRLQLDYSGWQLRFPAPLEAEFQHDYSSRYLGQMRLALLLGMLALAAVGLFDFYWMPARALQMWQMRLMVFLPTLTIQGLSYSPWGRRHIQALIVASASCAAGMLVLCAGIASAPYADYYRSGLSLVILIVFVLSRLQFAPGVAAALIILLELNLGFYAQDQHDLRLLSPANFLILASATCALVGTFMIERSVRQLFLQGRLLTFRLQGMEERNVQLKQLSATDGLTRLANRSALDATLAFEWQRARLKQQALALLMIDVDHFKRFNDYYGHPAGDDCLRRVANAISAAARRPFDLAARYGGEEFCIVLTGASASHAAAVAERVRAGILQLGIAHAQSGHGLVSASIGVACLVPGPDSTLDTLLQAADRALYLAKDGGRNCVVVAAGSLQEHVS